MTESNRCRWCRRVLPVRNGPGRRKQFCSQACRQWDWVSRQQGGGLQLLAPDQMIVSRDEYDELRDDLYGLACALDDTDQDLHDAGPKPAASELLRLLETVMAAAKPLRDREFAAPKPPPVISS